MKTLLQEPQRGTSAADHIVMTNRDVPLCVDLDGTLLKSDLLVESALALLRRNPLYILLMPLWLARGKAKLKREIARRTVIDPTLLPYRTDFVAWLRSQREARKLILCTASDILLAERVAMHLAIFDCVEASDGVTNLSGAEKASRLVSRFGERGFDYAGNARADLEIWAKARKAVVVGATSRLQRLVSRRTKISETFPVAGGGIAAWLRALRLHQWAKNFLVFLAPLAAHSLFHPAVLWRAVAAWFVFGLCASGVYVLNDLLDLEADRAHPRKKYRPFASGTLPLQQALWANAILTVTAFAGAVLISPWFAIVLLCYWLLTNAYSLNLKRMAVLDVIVLAGLYTARILAGAAATSIEPSFWLLAFSMFFFLSLAILKRYAELDAQQRRGALNSAGRGYLVADLSVLTSLGSASGYLSVLVLALYVQSANSVELYRHPRGLWLLCPVLLYWISRAWFLLISDDPQPQVA